MGAVNKELQMLIKAIKSNDLTEKERENLKTGLMIILRELEEAHNKTTKELEEKLNHIDQLQKEFYLSLPIKIRNCPLAEFEGKINIMQDTFIGNHEDITFPNLCLFIEYKDNGNDRNQIVQTINGMTNITANSKSFSTKLTNSTSKNICPKTTSNQIIVKKIMEHNVPSIPLMQKITNKPLRTARENENINLIFMSDQGTPLVHPSSKQRQQLSLD